jgi:hypothetical protein
VVTRVRPGTADRPAVGPLPGWYARSRLQPLTRTNQHVTVSGGRKAE